MVNKVAYHSVVIDSEGNGTLATITVFAPGTATLATIYSSPEGAAQANPFDTDANGRFVFYADLGEYDIQASGTGFTTYTLSNVPVIGVASQFVRSDPPSTNYHINQIRLDASKHIVVVHDDTPEA
jgi:hypothetical protein